MNKYTYDEVYQASLEYFKGDDLAAKVFVDKYALQDREGKYDELTPNDMHHRLAKEFARIEAKYPNPMNEEEIFGLLKDFKYICPQGSPMSAIGNPYQIQSLSNCFVIQGVHSDKLDSFGGIMLADQELAQIFKRRGGCGLDISGIRPKDAPTMNAAKTTDGIGVFMEQFSNTCRRVATRGRRGAEMITISVDHPEIETFVHIKRDLKKITGANISIRINDDFMKAVKQDKEYVLRWPVDVSPDKAKITKTIKAKELWNQIVESSWMSAEPGILFWSTVKKNTPSDIYAEEGHESISTNPCFSGETLIAVADGRNAVSIKQLAEEEKDVPVYSVNKATGKVSVKWARHPRITGYDKKLVRVKLDDGSFFDATPDHKCFLLNGQQVLAKDLKSGDSLPRFTKALEPVLAGKKDYYQIICDVNDSACKVFEHRLIAQFYYPEEWKQQYSLAKNNGWVKTGGIVVHHKDYNQLNNAPDNLQIMTFRDHSILHGQIDQSGEKNRRYSGFTTEQIKNAALELTRKFGRRFSRNEWLEFAEEKGLPKSFSKFRQGQFKNVFDMAKVCAAELGLEYTDIDPRLVQTYKDMLSQGYEARIADNCVLVIRICEKCSNRFEVEHIKRERAYCSHSCAIHQINEEKMNKNKHEQARIYSELKFKFGRAPLMKEWENACKEAKVPYRVGRTLKFCFKNYQEVAEAGDNYNHKVVEVIELEGNHTVYNLTVDDNHTVGIITDVRNKRANNWYSGVFLPNCGEIVLPKYDACRLLVLNLLAYVKNPFTKKASFDFDTFNLHTMKAQRLMDDVIDLEIEQVNKILAKVESDPEPDEVKLVELNLWKKILAMNTSGRRTGLGITALGDCLASLNIVYGSDRSIEKTRKIYRALAVAAHTASCIMAKERGAFPIFNYDKEKNHEYLNDIFNDCSKETRQSWAATGRRNIALTTTAPTGTVSTLTQTTSGIEPAYLLSYTRRKKINSSDKNARIDFVDASGDQWQEFTVYHHGVKRWMGLTGETDIKKSPYWGATSNDINWVNSVELQAAAQASIDHSISKTCNLPSTATKELVSEVYMRAWESGCKGFTVYRDGSRSGVLISNETKSTTNDRPEDIKASTAPKRPTELPCEIKKAKIQGESWTFFIGLLGNKPYEVFGGLSKYIDIPNKYKQGKIVRNGKVDGLSTYNVAVGEGDDQMLIKDIVSVFENALYGSFTRTISLALRHGTPIQFVVEQLQKDKHSDMTSFSTVLARVLKQYITNGTTSTGEKICPSCKQEGTLVYQEGCLTCKTGCGYSKCG